ncbi:hypothetical protein HZ326_22521 [Fusarium oxysporum f. sp. albedinis]|nr:hypothetical protein HZ326_22521 [Fusarium oxysporum f. sp. albedinis]
MLHKSRGEDRSEDRVNGSRTEYRSLVSMIADVRGSGLRIVKMKLKYGTWPGQHQAGGTRSGGRFHGSDCIVK